MDVLNLFTIQGEVSPDKTQLATAFIAIKTWNIERAARLHSPGVAFPDNPDNADIAGPDSVYDWYV